MAKFKVGDRVRRVREVHMGMREGDEATVTKATTYNHVELDAYGGQHSNDMLELANDNSPVRTVTRREIVPGTYDGVEIRKTGLVRTIAWLDTAEDIRAAVRIFNEIADVLDEQSAEVKKEAA